MSDQAIPVHQARKYRLPKINPVYVLVVALLLAIIILNPAFGEPTGYMNFLKRVTALAILRLARFTSLCRVGSISASAR